MKIVQYNDNWKSVGYQFRLVINGHLYKNIFDALHINDDSCGRYDEYYDNDKILNTMEFTCVR